MTGTNSLKKRKIVVLGSRSVGKTSLILQFVENHFIDAYYPTIEANHQKTVKYKGTEFQCEIVDTAGQDEYSIIQSKHVIGVHGFVLVYSVASRNSFNMVQNVYDKIIDFCGKQEIPCVIVGSKTDLLESSRQVSSTEGAQLAKQNHAAWVETSAKSNNNISEVFELCIAEIEKGTSAYIKQEAPPPTPSKTSCCIM
ncbi:rheb small monomeric GTPase RhbA [Agrocybe pediades]|nr:rheb small monomeric GTPase RhbA [Agrocybe pediades]